MNDASDDPLPPTIEWLGDRIRLIDQRCLPGRLVFLDITTVEQLAVAIEDLAIRGAPALGVAGAMGVALAVVNGDDLPRAAERLLATRPTAVNLAWGVRRALAAADPVVEAQLIAERDIATCMRIGAHGLAIVPMGARILTHCNAGALACVRYGTALGVIRAAHDQGKQVSVWVDETRPVLQGARLTAWELDLLGIASTLVVDGAAGSLMATGAVDLVVVGADRIAANGDVVNKVGTYGLAVLAHYHGIGFYVAAPLSTVDPKTPDGASIEIEQRHANEVSMVAGTRITPATQRIDNRAFDVTPNGLVSAYISEAGVFVEAVALIEAALTSASSP